MNRAHKTIFVFLVLCSAAASHVQAQSLKVHGIVTDANTHLPVAGARVVASGDTASASDSTDDRGVFSLPLQPKVKAGDLIRIYVLKSGYQPADRKETASSEATLTIELVPQKKKAGNRNSSAPKPPPSLPTQSAGVNPTVTGLRTPGRGSGNSLQITFKTDGTKDQYLSLGVRPLRLAFRPPGVIVEEGDLPKRVIVQGRSIRLIRFTHDGFVIDSRGVRGISLQVSVVDAKEAQDPSDAPPQTQRVQINAPNGIGITGGVVNNPTVNNFGPPPPPTPNVKLCVTYTMDTEDASLRVTVIHAKTDFQIPRPWFAFFFDGPVLDGRAGSANGRFVLGYEGSRASKMPNSENSFVFRLNSIDFATTTWFPGDGAIRITVPSRNAVKLIKVLAGAGDDRDATFNLNLVYVCD